MKYVQYTYFSHLFHIYFTCFSHFWSPGAKTAAALDRAGPGPGPWAGPSRHFGPWARSRAPKYEKKYENNMKKI